MPTTDEFLLQKDMQAITGLTDETKSLIYYGLASLKRDIYNTRFIMVRDNTINGDLANFYNTVENKISGIEAILLTSGKEHLSLFNNFSNNHKAFQ